MTKPASVIPLLSKWEDYIAANLQGDIRGFAYWLIAEERGDGPPGSSIPSYPLAGTEHLDETAQSSLLIVRLHRILNLYAKPAIKELGFTRDREFGVLVQVAIMDKPNKKELCRELLIEGSTGVEITKRLAKKGYLHEETDEKDKRSARLTLTEKGKNALLEGYQKLALSHCDFLNGLSPEQKKELVFLLARLNDYHTHQLSTASRVDLRE